tara:strand:+ start:111 stop:275 length:165 start_codon:yes stop_codon:yes gene_type:complete
MPQEYMRERQSRTVEEEKTRFWVRGFTPPLARVAAMILAYRNIHKQSTGCSSES